MRPFKLLVQSDLHEEIGAASVVLKVIMLGTVPRSLMAAIHLLIAQLEELEMHRFWYVFCMDKFSKMKKEKKMILCPMVQRKVLMVLVRLMIIKMSTIILFVIVGGFAK